MTIPMMSQNFGSMAISVVQAHNKARRSCQPVPGTPSETAAVQHGGVRVMERNAIFSRTLHKDNIDDYDDVDRGTMSLPHARYIPPQAIITRKSVLLATSFPR